MPPDLAAELAALEAMPDDTIDTSDIPEARDWSEAARGRFCTRRAKTGEAAVGGSSTPQA